MEVEVAHNLALAGKTAVMAKLWDLVVITPKVAQVRAQLQENLERKTVNSTLVAEVVEYLSPLL